MNPETAYRVIAVVVAVVIGLIGLLLGQSWDLFAYLSIPILLVLILYVLIVSQMMNMERSIFAKMKSISQNPEFIEGDDSVTKTLIETMNEADEAIFTTGGKVREVDYLGALARKILDTGATYYRVILGDHIQHTFHEHLRELIEKKSCSVHIGHQPEEKYGNMLITNDKVILYLPSPSFEGLDTVLKIADPNLARKYQLYVMQIYAESEKITDNEGLKKLCIQCKA